MLDNLHNNVMQVLLHALKG